MRIFLLVLFSLQIFIPQCYSSEPTLRALIVADTLTPSTKKALRYDIWRMENSLDAISRQIGRPIKRHTIKDKNFTIKNVKKWLHSLPKSSNDIIFFYYTGHGCGDALKKPWPVLNFSLTAPYKPLGGSAIVKYLKNKLSRLTIILFDCCNCEPFSDNHVTSLKEDEVMINNQRDLPGLRTLFCQTKGVIIAAAADLTESASAQTFETPKGSTFSVGFIRALSEHCNTQEITWEKYLITLKNIAFRRVRAI